MMMSLDWADARIDFCNKQPEELSDSKGIWHIEEQVK